jgi:hypothetical protein
MIDTPSSSSIEDAEMDIIGQDLVWDLVWPIPLSDGQLLVAGFTMLDINCFLHQLKVMRLETARIH